MADCMNVAAAAATVRIGSSPSRHRRLFAVATSLPLIAALALTPALAEDFTVESPDVVGQQTMHSGGRGVVEAGGTISTGNLAENAVNMLANDQMLENFGLISTTGNSALGIGSIGAYAVITNLGTISTTGSGAYGIYSSNSGANATLVNSGTISTTGSDARGISSSGANATLTNSGIISTTGNDAYGVASLGSKAAITNSGTISTVGDFAEGIRSGGGDATLTNSGAISTVGIFANGITSGGPKATISNSGTISTTGINAEGIRLGGSDATLINSGTIISEQSDAIRFSQNNATLNLLAGTAIQGGIRFNGSGNTVSFGPGLNTMLTFSGILFPETILTGGNPYAVSGARIAVLDRGGFALADDMVLGLAGNIAGVVNHGGRGQCLPAADGELPIGDNDGCAIEAWLAGFGGFGGRPDSSSLAGSGYLSGGGLAGLEFTPGGSFSGGIFLGAMAAHGSVGDSQDTTQYGGVVGGHAGFASDGYFADFHAALGVLQIDSERTVANNTVDGGLTVASASQAGYFFSPAVTIGTDLETGAGILTPSLRLRYAGLMLDGYSESGDDGVDIDARLVHELELRAQLALALTPSVSEDGTLSAVLRAGADVLHRQSDIITGTLLGQPIAFTSGDDGTGYRGFAGFDLDLALGGGTSLFGNVELGLDSTGGYSATAHAGIGGAF